MPSGPNCCHCSWRISRFNNCLHISHAHYLLKTSILWSKSLLFFLNRLNLCVIRRTETSGTRPCEWEASNCRQQQTNAAAWSRYTLKILAAALQVRFSCIWLKTCSNPIIHHRNRLFQQYVELSFYTQVKGLGAYETKLQVLELRVASD